MEVGGNTLNKLDLVAFLPVSTVLQKYNLDFRIHELVMNNRFVDAKLDSVPYFLKLYLDEKRSNHKVSYIRTEIDTTYWPSEQYAYFKINDSISQYHEKTMAFYKDASKIRLRIADSIYNSVNF